jgi:hypothetical protein
MHYQHYAKYLAFTTKCMSVQKVAILGCACVFMTKRHTLIFNSFAIDRSRSTRAASLALSPSLSTAQPCGSIPFSSHITRDIPGAKHTTYSRTNSAFKISSDSIHIEYTAAMLRLLMYKTFLEYLLCLGKTGDKSACKRCRTPIKSSVINIIIMRTSMLV